MDNILNTLNTNINNIVSNIIVDNNTDNNTDNNRNIDTQNGGNNKNIVQDILNKWDKTIINGCFICFLSIIILYLLYLIHNNWNDIKAKISNWDNLCLWVYFIITITSILHYIVNEIIIKDEIIYNNDNIFSISKILVMLYILFSIIIGIISGLPIGLIFLYKSNDFITKLIGVLLFISIIILMNIAPSILNSIKWIKENNYLLFSYNCFIFGLSSILVILFIISVIDKSI
tara:strand:- start:1487 stop:2179 length:693 start_codon:yes stop_codon:yes gene_type:complete